MTTSIYKRTQNFLNKAKLIHNNKYDYSLVEYINAHIKIKIICPIHGTFIQSPRSHKNGSGCPNCSTINQSKRQTSNNKTFINESKIIHNNKYDYSLIEYKQSIKKVKIICPIHGIFKQSPHSHKNGSGCPKCSQENHLGCYNLTTLNRDPQLANNDATLYIIKHNHLYKVGITTLNVFQRFTKSIQVISELNNISLIESFTKEQEILSKYSQFKEKPKNWKYGGYNEFLNITTIQLNQILINYFIH